MSEIHYVTEEDRDFWFSLDKHLSNEEFEEKIRRKMGYVIFDEGAPIGIMRYNLFWDNTPFCTMIFVNWNSQSYGYGSELMEHWQEEMKAKGYAMVMTSSQVDESAQHFYRKLGFQDAGGLVMNLPGFEQPMEMFFVKAL